MGSWIHDGFLKSLWVLGFTVWSWIHDGFSDKVSGCGGQGGNPFGGKVPETFDLS